MFLYQINSLILQSIGWRSTIFMYFTATDIGFDQLIRGWKHYYVLQRRRLACRRGNCNKYWNFKLFFCRILNVILVFMLWLIVLSSLYDVNSSRNWCNNLACDPQLSSWLLIQNINLVGNLLFFRLKKIWQSLWRKKLQFKANNFFLTCHAKKSEPL